MSSKKSVKKGGRKILAGKIHEQNFLTETRKPVKERRRLNPIHDEFTSAFNELGGIGPVVTLFEAVTLI